MAGCRTVRLCTLDLWAGANDKKGRYQFYAVDVNTLQDKSGFPFLIDVNFADNDHTRFEMLGVWCVNVCLDFKFQVFRGRNSPAAPLAHAV